MKYVSYLFMAIIGFWPTVYIPAEYELESVGMKVELEGDWQEEYRQSSTDKERYFGFQYMIEVDISDSTDYVFNELYVERHDYYDEQQKSTWLRELPREATAEKVEVLGEIDLDDFQVFDKRAVFKFREVRGAQPSKRSMGYVVYAVDNDRAYRIKVAGLENHFQENPQRYQDILRSIEIM